MNKKGHLGNQKGFTLIEIIAVLLLLGIMAAVAVPRYFNMQAETEFQTLKIALNDMKSRAVIAHSASLLANDGIAQAADQNGFDDFGFAALADINGAAAGAYKDFLGAWALTSNTLITYTPNYPVTGMTTCTFALTTAGTATAPAVITLAKVP